MAGELKLLLWKKLLHRLVRKCSAQRNSYDVFALFVSDSRFSDVSFGCSLVSSAKQVAQPSKGLK
jgi:hypothetical protein